MAAPLRLVVYDRTDDRSVSAWLRATGAKALGADGTSAAGPGLSPAWWAGTWLHRLAGAADASLGATSWTEALAWAAGVAAEKRRPIGSLQLWGHGGWGFMKMGASALDERALRADHELAPRVDALRGALSGPEALVWFRCCSAFGTASGQSFARAATRRFGCRVAGHTFIIGAWQSGTHTLAPGQEPAWDLEEGVVVDDARKPLRARWSWPHEPSTISCLKLDPTR